MNGKTLCCLVAIQMLRSAHAFAEPGNMCQKTDKPAKIATLETPRGPASGKLCFENGASFSIGPTWVLLDGVKAPSLERHCKDDHSRPFCKFATISMDAFADLIANGVACKAEKSEGSRWLSTCTLPDGRDAGAVMVRQGFLCADKSRSSRFVEDEIDARTNKRGLWADEIGYPDSDCGRK